MSSVPDIQSLAVTVGETLTDIVTVECNTLDSVSLEVAVLTNDLDQFQVHAKFNEAGSFQPLYTTAADFITPKGILLATSGDLTLIAPTTSGWLIIDTTNLHTIKLQAASDNAAGSIVSVLGRATNE